MVAGGLGRTGEVQKFDRTAASVQSTMLFLAATALVMPAIYELVEGNGLPWRQRRDRRLRRHRRDLSLAVAGVLLVTYVLGLFFSLKTHKDVFNPGADDEDDDEDLWGWSAAPR